MARVKQALAAAVLSCVGSMPALAASSAASSASDSVSTSVGSISGSIQKSSNSSSANNGVAEGDYRIIDVAAVAERPGTVRMKLQAVVDGSADGEFFLYLPQAVADQAHLAPGGIVTARQRPYGIEFADGQTQRAFYLVLGEDWYRELQANVVTL
jgi:hypothetical protein